MEISAVNINPLEDKQNIQIRETVRKERSRLLAFIRRRIPDNEDAEDILQDVFFELTEMYRMLRPIEQATAWLFRVARNKITDRARKKKPELLEDALYRSAEPDGDDDPLMLADILPDLGASPEDELLRNTILEALSEALDELPDEQRAVFVAHELEGKSFKEISFDTGLSVNTLLSRKRYAVLYLRAQLRDLYSDLADEP
jgi:RNA polymerase sigma factor (sigma-70 family)